MTAGNKRLNSKKREKVCKPGQYARNHYKRNFYMQVVFGGKVSLYCISAFPMYYTLNNWIGKHEITKQKQIYLLLIQKRDTKTSTKRHE